MMSAGNRVSVVGYDPSDLKYGAINGEEGVITADLGTTSTGLGAYDSMLEVELDNFPGDPWVFYADELAVI